LREYTKGRDYYDLYWYFSNFSHKKFNREYISNIIIQYNKNNNKNKTIPKTHKETLNMILEKLENTDYNKVKEDLKRFLDWSNDKLDLFFEKYNENMIRMIKIYNDNIENDTKNSKTFRL
jgi:catalase (peroxidase I)